MECKNNYGIKIGYNDAFIIDEATKNMLIESGAKSAQIIRPILRGKDIKKYSYKFANQWLIYVPWHFSLHLDSSIKGASKKLKKNLNHTTRQYIITCFFIKINFLLEIKQRLV